MNNVLIGKTITAIWIAEDKQSLKFEIEGSEPIIAKTDAECCSHSWIENIENPEAAVGSPVLVAEDIEMPDQGEMPDREVVAYYGFKIETAKGTCTIDYRNESNGYYGGSLEWPLPSGEYHYFYGGVYQQNVSKEQWQLLAGIAV